MLARLRETNVNGYGRCCSCGQQIAWDKAHGGHFQSKGRNYNAACLIEENVHLQCSTCNMFRGGEAAGYSMYMYANYDESVIDHIKQRSFEIMEREEIEERIVELRKKCRELAKGKNFTVSIP